MSIRWFRPSPSEESGLRWESGLPLDPLYVSNMWVRAHAQVPPTLDSFFSGPGQQGVQVPIHAAQLDGVDPVGGFCADPTVTTGLHPLPFPLPTLCARDYANNIIVLIFNQHTTHFNEIPFF